MKVAAIEAINKFIESGISRNAQIIVLPYRPTKRIMPIMARICFTFFIYLPHSSKNNNIDNTNHAHKSKEKYIEKSADGQVLQGKRRSKKRKKNGLGKCIEF